jgi:hypothetical protein
MWECGRVTFRRSVVLVLAVVVGLGLLAVAFFLGDKYAVDHMTVERVRPSQVATAMQQDYFFSKYRASAVLMSGTVASAVTSPTHQVIRFETAGLYRVFCTMQPNAPKLHVGERVTIITTGAQAVRLTNGVMLNRCVLFAP